MVRCPSQVLPPEVFRLILECLHKDDVNSLRKAVLVNKTWASDGLSVLWKKPFVASLALIEPGRRQSYASLIRDLSFVGATDGWDLTALRFLKFPRLTDLSINFLLPKCGAEEKRRLEQRVLAIQKARTSSGTEDSISQLQTDAQSDMIRFALLELNPSHLVEFFENCESLRTIRLFINDLTDDNVFTCLVDRDGLKKIHLEKPITYKMVTEALGRVRNPFRDVRCFNLRLESIALIPLVPVITPTILELRVTDRRINVLRLISSLTDLRELNIIFENSEAPFSQEEFLALKRLRNLQTLGIFGYNDVVHERATFRVSNRDWDEVFSNLPELRVLNWGARSSLSSEAIVSLGQHCRHLEVCQIYGRYDLQVLSKVQAPLFPELRQLETQVGEVDEAMLDVPSISMSPNEIAQLIVYHAPKLTYLFMSDVADFSYDVVHAFRELRGMPSRPPRVTFTDNEL